MAKLSRWQVARLRLLKEIMGKNISNNTLSELFHISFQHVSSILNNKTRKTETL